MERPDARLRGYDRLDQGFLKPFVFVTGALGCLIALLSLSGGRPGANAAAAAPAASPPAAAAVAGLYFEPAPGAGDSARSRFVARGEAHVTWIHPAGAQIALPRAAGNEGAGGVSRVGLRLVAANGNAAGFGAAPLRGRSHYYLGSDPAAWREGVPHYARVEYPEVYPGIGMAYHGEQGGLEFDFIVAPGADPGLIRLAFDPVPALRLNDRDELELETGQGRLTLKAPVAYQEVRGHRDRVDVAYALDDTGQGVSFRLGAYDRSIPLVIDPVISYADYLGGSEDDTGVALAVDQDGNRYVTGSTLSDDFAGVAGSVAAQSDVYVAKLAPDGERLYVTYLGGIDDEMDLSNAIAVDGAGRAHVVGYTESEIFPMLGALQPGYAGGGDAFVARLTADGALGYSTYLGGSATDTAQAIALDVDGNMYVGGGTLSDNLPGMSSCSLQCARAAPAPGEPAQGDGFIAKISADGANYLYATYLGGSGADNVWTLAVDESNAAYVAGTTGSPDFPQALSPPFPPVQAEFQGGVSDGYVAKISPDGAALIYSTYLGGSAFDRVLALALDSDQNAYVTGLTASGSGFGDFLTSPGTPPYGGGAFDAFASKLAPDGATLLYSTFIGGGGDDRGLAIDVNDQGEAIVVGETQSGNFPLKQPLQVQRLGNRNGFITALAADGMSREFSTYLGGAGEDRVTAVAVEDSDSFHAAGTGSSTALPAVDAVQDDNAGGTDAFILRIETDDLQALPDLTINVDAPPESVPMRQNLFFDLIVDNRGAGDASGVMILVDGTNVTALSSPTSDCEATTGTTILCAGGDISAGSFNSLEIEAVPQAIGVATLTATLVRADQSGINPADNSDSIERQVVDNSDEDFGGLGWELFALLPALPFLRRRMASRTQALSRAP